MICYINEYAYVLSNLGERKLNPPVSVRLEADVRAELSAQARARGVGLSTLLRDIAAEAARAVRRARIRAAGEAVARHVDGSDEARAFYDFWGTPEPQQLGQL